MRDINKKEVYNKLSEEFNLDKQEVANIAESQFSFLSETIQGGEYKKGVRLKGFGSFTPRMYKVILLMIKEEKIKELLAKWQKIAISDPDRRISVKLVDFVKILKTCEKLYKYKTKGSSKGTDTEVKKGN